MPTRQALMHGSRAHQLHRNAGHAKYQGSTPLRLTMRGRLRRGVASDPPKRAAKKGIRQDGVALLASPGEGPMLKAPS